MARLSARLSSNKRVDQLHHDVLSAMDSALDAADPRSIIQRHVKVSTRSLLVDGHVYPLKRAGRILVIGAGKASGYMAEEVERLLGRKISNGLVIVPDYLRPWPKGRRINYHPGTHPIPSEKNVQGVKLMLELVEDLRNDDLVITLLSGGASALMEYPLEGVNLRDEGKTTDLLLKSGARIQEINTVRKHLSRVKGGRLAEILHPARVLTLIISDVVGDQLDTIGSGPTAPDPTKYRNAKEILQHYDIWSRIPTRVRRIVNRGIRGSIPETPKDTSIFRRVKNLVIGTNRAACTAAVHNLESRGYSAHLLSTRVVGEAREAGGFLGSILSDIRDSQFFTLPAAIVSGGETTVTVKGKGKGGRNQELALATAMAIQGLKGLVVGSLATDGVEGQTDAAGALVDGTTIARGRRRGMDPEEFLENNDSYNYFAELGDLVKTGPTGTNVNDITIAVAK